MIGPRRPNPVKERALRVRAPHPGRQDLPLRGQLLPDRDALHPLRHRGRLPLPGRRHRPGGRERLRPGRDRRLRLPADGGAGLRLGAGERSIGNRGRATSAPKQLRARATCCAGDLEGEELERLRRARASSPRNLESVLNWARANSICPLTFGLACCAIEMMAMVTARHDMARFGAEALRASPRQADMLILSGRRLDQDGAGRAPHLRPDAGAEVGDLDGRLLVLRRHVRQLRRRPGSRQVHAGRHPRPGLPAAPRGAPARLQQAAAQDPRQPRPRLAPALQRDRHRGVGARRARRAGRRGARRRRSGSPRWSRDEDA